jgi:hypothetical protein
METITRESATLSEIGRPIFLRWERLRIPYNLALLGMTLLFHWNLVRGLLSSWAVWFVLVSGAILANLCFFAGPVAESYMAWLGYRSRWIGVTLFVGGVAISVPLVLLFPMGFGP